MDLRRSSAAASSTEAHESSGWDAAVEVWKFPELPPEVAELLETEAPYGWVTLIPECLVDTPVAELLVLECRHRHGRVLALEPLRGALLLLTQENAVAATVVEKPNTTVLRNPS